MALCVLLAAGFLALGLWQIERRAWKLDLIARVNARVHAVPQPLPPRAVWPQINERSDSYRRVRVRGVLLDEHETLVQALTDRGAGWWVITPLRTDAGIVLINRGFVPPERRDPAGRTDGSRGNPVVITGLLRMSEPGGGFLRANDPAADRWYSRDVQAIARARGLADIAPFFIDAEAEPHASGYPIGGLTVIAFRNTHLVYALTWFALSALSIGGVVLLWRARLER
jgi:surfeit locus 1 family protein